MTDHRKSGETEVQRVKLQRARDGKAATLDYEAQAAATHAKTERLRALRLSRDAAAGLAAPARSKPARASPKGGKKKPAGTLADWMRDQEKDGR